MQMKKLKLMMLTLMMSLITVVSFGQEVKYDDVQFGLVKKGKFETGK